MKDLKIFTNNIEDSAKAQIDLLLEQTSFFSTVKIEFKQTNNSDKTNIIEYCI